MDFDLKMKRFKNQFEKAAWGHLERSEPFGRSSTEYPDIRSDLFHLLNTHSVQPYITHHSSLVHTKRTVYSLTGLHVNVVKTHDLIHSVDL